MSMPNQLKTESVGQAETIFGLYGAGGYGREVMPLIPAGISISGQDNISDRFDVVFVEESPQSKTINSRPVVSEDEFFALNYKNFFFNVAIGDSKVRQKIAIDCLAKGAKPFSIRSPHSIMYDNNEVGEGAILCAYTMITSNAKIGKFFHSNIYSYVAHDCVIGDYVTFAPNVRCNGNVHIHNHAYIGTNAVIKHGSLSKPLIIGEGAVVGMGAVVTKDVPPFTTVVGNPAKPFGQPSK